MHVRVDMYGTWARLNPVLVYKQFPIHLCIPMHVCLPVSSLWRTYIHTLKEPHLMLVRCYDFSSSGNPTHQMTSSSSFSSRQILQRRRQQQEE